MKIEVEKTPAVQRGRPGAVHLRLVGDDGETKGFVSVYPRFEKPPFSDTFRVEIHKGDMISSDVDIRVNV